MGTENARQQGNGVVGSTLTEESQSTSSAEDVAFALRVRQGDHGAFQALYERYGGAVLGLAQSVVRDRAVAERQQSVVCRFVFVHGSDGEAVPVL